jgi:hypothetical protein
MKITVEISDPLLRTAREMATHERVALRTLVERGLRRLVTEAKTDAPFKLRRASFKGKGLRPRFDGPHGTASFALHTGDAAS